MNVTNPKPSFITIAFLVLISLTLVSPVSAQSWQEEIIQKLQLHQTLHHNEKVFVQTDRPIYLPGETLWFNAFIIYAATQELNQTEVVLHVELLNQDKSIFLKEMFKIENGLAAGQLELKENTKPGKYYLVAYTNWMRNAGSEYYFSKEIIVSGEGERSHSTGISASSQQNNKLANEIGEVSEVKQQLQIEFYPEGGDLVNGISSKVAFEVRDALGLPQSFNGMVVDDEGQIVTAAKTMWRGKGVFTLAPQPYKQYFIKEAGQTDTLNRYPLPNALSEGLAMTVVDQDIENPLTITVSKSGSIADTTLFLLATQNGKVKDALIINMSGRETLTTELAKTEFNSGIVQLTLFDQNQMARTERLVFIKKEDALNIVIKEDKLPEGSRDSVLLTMMVTSQDGDPVEGNFSIAVTDATRVPDKAYGSANINQYVSLYSDLPGLKLNDPILFEDTGESNFKSELLMLTNGWRRYQWEEVLTDSLTIPDYLEEPGIYVKGKVTSLLGKDKVAKNAEVTMIAGNVFNSYNDKLDKNGEFTFIMRDFYDSKRVTIQTKNKKGKKKDFEIDIKTNYQSDTIDQFEYLSQAYSLDINSVDQNTQNIQISKAILQKELSRVIVEDTFIVTTDVSIKEVDIEAETKKLAKTEMNEKYGVPNSSIGKIKVEELIKEKSWYEGLFSLLYEAYPDLRISTGLFDLSKDRSGKSALNHGAGGGLSNYTTGSEFDDSIGPRREITFQLIGKQRHRFFVFIDGQMIAASNTRGALRKAYGNYTLDDLLALDPNEVQSIDLIFPDSEAAKARLTDEARYYNGGDEIDRTVPGGSNPFIYQSEIISTPVAVLSIYTKAGGGLYSTTAYKGISNVTIQGYKRTKEFYHFNYSTAFKDSVQVDERNTLAWYPNFKTDENGKAQIQFYASDVSDKIRLEINGISNVGETGSLIYQTPDSLFYYNRNVTSSRVIPNITGGNSKYMPNTLLSDDSPVDLANISSDDNNLSSLASANEMFSVEDEVLQPNNSNSQVISGIVMDAHTKETIPNVAVYYDQTFEGTTTDLYGSFKINRIKDRSLVFSSIGYYSASISDYSSLEDLKIFLKPKNYEVGEVTVNSESLEKQRAKNMRLFKKHFIGTTKNARKCRILNEDDITFNYNSESDTLKAYALKPIEIENNGLGYRITYYLDNFEYSTKDDLVRYSGNIIYNEDLSKTGVSYEKNRERAYLGSRMHFVRSLFTDDLYSEGFEVRGLFNHILDMKELVRVEEKEQGYLKKARYNTVFYKGSRKSSIIFNCDSVLIDKTGYYSSGITWTGDMSRNRIGDLLPYNYETEPQSPINSEISDETEILKKVYQARFINRNTNNIYFQGAFREKLLEGDYLHCINDYGFIQQWPSIKEKKLHIISEISGGREYYSTEFDQKIKFTSLKPYGPIPFTDPVYNLESFLDLNFQKQYQYILLGQTEFQGRKMYHIQFDQIDDLPYAYFEGELLIDIETYGVAWASWKRSKKGQKYIMPDMYITSDYAIGDFELVNEHREMTWKFNGEIWEPDFAVLNVSFYQNGDLKKINQEIKWESISQDEYKSQRKSMPKEWNKNTTTKRDREYNPSEWRDSWLLPPDKIINEQIKYLNEMISYE